MIRKFIENHLVNSAKNTMLDVIENTGDIEFLKTEFTKTLNEKWDLEKERDTYKSIVEELKERIKIGKGKYSNKKYDLIFDMEEVPKNEINDFIIYLAIEALEAIINQVECNKIKELEEGKDND